MTPVDVYIHQPSTTIADYKDILAWSIACVSLVVTGLAVVAAYILGQKYNDHVDEIKAISEKFSAIERYYEETKNVHTRLVSKLDLAFGIDVRVHELAGMIGNLEKAYQNIGSQGTLMGSPISAQKQAAASAEIARQLAMLRTQQEARRYELLCLAAEYPARLNHARYLADIYGDTETIKFLEKYADTMALGSEKYEYIKLIGALEARLRLPAPTVQPFVNSKLWTG